MLYEFYKTKTGYLVCRYDMDTREYLFVDENLEFRRYATLGEYQSLKEICPESMKVYDHENFEKFKGLQMGPWVLVLEGEGQLPNVYERIIFRDDVVTDYVQRGELAGSWVSEFDRHKHYSDWAYGDQFIKGIQNSDT